MKTKTFFYYTKWKFKPIGIPADLDHDIFHTTWQTESPPKEFLERTRIDDLSEFFMKQFDTQEEMESYFLSQNPS